MKMVQSKRRLSALSKAIISPAQKSPGASVSASSSNRGAHQSAKSRRETMANFHLCPNAPPYNGFSRYKKKRRRMAMTHLCISRPWRRAGDGDANNPAPCIPPNARRMADRQHRQLVAKIPGSAGTSAKNASGGVYKSLGGQWGYVAVCRAGRGSTGTPARRRQ